MKKVMPWSLALLLGAMFLSAAVVPLPELLKPVNLYVDDTQFYITEGTSIFIYSQKNHRLIKKFGKEGEGPEEFKILPQLPLILNVTTDHLVVNSLGKISHFTKSGEFIREEKVKGGFVFALLPLGDHLAGQGLTQENNVRFRSINIYDQQLNKIKEISKVEDNFQAPGQGIRVLHEAFVHQTIDDRLYTATERDFVIRVFSESGREQKPITLSYDLVPMTQKHRDDIVEFFETDPSTKAFAELLKPYRFPEAFPAVAFMFAADDQLYVMTWRREHDRNEFFVFEKNGTLVRRSTLPLKYRNAILPFPFAIHAGKFYQIIENEGTEEWELHVTPLD